MPVKVIIVTSKFKNEYSVQHTVSVMNPTVEAKKISTVLKKSMQGCWESGKIKLRMVGILTD